jgi:hypothetical protein
MIPQTLAPIFYAALQAHAPALPVEVATAQIRAESAWRVEAMRRTPTEQGCGLAQFTRTWRPGGQIRFDTLSEMRFKYPQTLGGWSWDKCTEPRYQLTAYALYMRDIDRALNLPTAFDVAAYNQGIGGVRRDQALCKRAQGCDPMQWFGNVEKHCGATMQLADLKRSACAVNRAYVKKVVPTAQLRPQEEIRIVENVKPIQPATENPSVTGRHWFDRFIGLLSRAFA